MATYYDRRIAAFTAHAGLIEVMAADLHREGEALVNLYHALRLAFRERCNRDFDDRVDSFNEADEQRADELLELLPE
ncbi:hypothetical protein [Acidobacterium sp. S8]|uniref:hypothetical protein n=1 Tax=Acidobacterium sp. S8 TaxID=1641854 RepID=UPI00131C97B4|nr:hypothetical protein [Acidobacterium sp. S8]